MRAAILMWFVIFVLFVSTAYAGRLPFSLLITIIACFAVREFYLLNGITDRAAHIAAMLLLVAMAAAVATERLLFFYSIPGLALLVFFPLHMFRHGASGIIRAAALQVAGLAYWGWLFLHFLLLHRLDCGFGAIVVLNSMIACNDNAAYYTGKFLGRNSPKFAPRVSPNKTWVGVAGGTAATVIVAFAFSYALPAIALWQRLVLALLVAVAIPVGDLVESAMKRDLGVKDSGTLIPGHGGMMDRFDSWAFTAPVVYYALVALAMVPA